MKSPTLDGAAAYELGHKNIINPGHNNAILNKHTPIRIFHASDGEYRQTSSS
jgi:hypothetical protein